MVWGESLTSPFCVWMYKCPSTISWEDFYSVGFPWCPCQKSSSRFISRSYLFLWSTYLSLCQYHGVLNIEYSSFFSYFPLLEQVLLGCSVLSFLICRCIPFTHMFCRMFWQLFYEWYWSVVFFSCNVLPTFWCQYWVCIVYLFPSFYF